VCGAGACSSPCLTFLLVFSFFLSLSLPPSSLPLSFFRCLPQYVCMYIYIYYTYLSIYILTYIEGMRQKWGTSECKDNMVCWRQSCLWHIHQHTSAYVSIRQHTSAYVSIRQHSSAVFGIYTSQASLSSLSLSLSGSPVFGIYTSLKTYHSFFFSL